MNRNIHRGTVFSVENESRKIVAAIQRNGTIQHYECTLFCCESPVCTCGTVEVDFSPRNPTERSQSGSSYRVEFDVLRKKIASEDERKVSKENLAFANLLLSSMDDADFEFLWKRYFAHKNEMTEQAPLDSIMAEFDFREIEEDGLMAVYRDILPYSESLFVHLKGEKCVALDQYCLRSKCPCTDAILTFVSVDEESDHSDKELFTVSVNYAKKRWSAVEAQEVAVDLEAAQSAMEEQIPDIYERLRKRHIKLKGIYAHCRKRHFKQPLQVPKVGRNDPCPCGSGKKFKKCCM